MYLRLKYFVFVIFALILFPAFSSAATNVYYSVGQTSSNLMTGSPTVTVSSTTAIFSVAQTGNIGVGDKVTYGGAVAYISGKLTTDDTQWSLVTATGTAPIATTSAPVTAINRAFTSLNSALSSATGVSYMATSSLVNGLNYSGGYILNIPCYYDSGPDYASVTMPTTYATGPNNYINIFTPNSTSTQSNQSQRHDGGWTSNAYQLDATQLSIKANYVRVIGLQIMSTSSGAVLRTDGMIGTGGQVILDSNIVTGVGNSGSVGIYIGNTSVSATFIALNNIVYGFQKGIYLLGGTSYYVYNNTVYNTTIGYALWATSGQGVIKNNIAQDSSSDGFNIANGFTALASSTDNISDKSDAVGSNALNAATVTFVSTSTSNFHLSIIDTTARGEGANLTSDSGWPFSYDIDGQSRPSSGAWDIGADEWAPIAATPPTISAFTLPSSSLSPLVAVTALSATSTTQIPIVGYLINESSSVPTVTDPGWSASPPPSFIFAGTGARTAYAWAMDAYGNISSGALASVAITATPYSGLSSLGTPIPKSFFGQSVEDPYYANNGNFNFPSVPFGSMRLWTGKLTWDALEPANGAYNFTLLNEMLDAAGAAGGNIIYTFGDTPEWATGTTTIANLPPSDIGSGDNIWKGFVTALVKDSLAQPVHIKYYELWNEPNATNGWEGTDAQLVTMSADAYTIIHALDPSAKVLTPVVYFSGGNDGATWLSNYFAAGGSAYVDGVSFHQYVGPDMSQIASSTAAIKSVMAAYGVSTLPILLTEGDYASTTLTTDQEKTSIAEYFIYPWELGLSAAYWFAWDGGTTGGMFDTTNGVYPNASADAQVYDWLEGSYEVNSSPCYQTLDSAQHCNLVMSNGNPAQIVWNNATSSESIATPSFTSYQTLDNSTQSVITGNAATISSKPILLVNDLFDSPSETPSSSNTPSILYFAAPSSVNTLNSSSLTIPITNVGAVDDFSTTTGYMITESDTQPSASASGWSVSAPTQYTFSNPNGDTLYPWVKDAAGQVNSAANAAAYSETVTLTHNGPINVYYSVGQTSANLMTGSPTVTVSGNTATFSTAQTGNIGVGDEVSYGGAIAYISGKLASNDAKWSLVTATGTAPIATTTAPVVSIARAYTSLRAALESLTDEYNIGVADSAHLNTYNLPLGDYVVNLACYYDTGPDCTTVQMLNYFTGPSNYINIFTPVDTQTQANYSQRHTGAWTSNAYQLDAPLYVQANYVDVTGLQLTATGTSATYALRTDSMTGTGGSVLLDDNIVWGQITGGGAPGSVGIYAGNTAVDPTMTLANNLVYGFSKGIQFFGMSDYAYNNTVYGASTGYVMWDTNGHATLKNDIAQDDSSAGFNTLNGFTTDAASTNNLSDKADAPGSNPVDSATVAFVSTSTSNYHLAGSDTAARGEGANLSSDTIFPFADDIDGQSRPLSGAWDIGADEYLPLASSSVTLNTSSINITSPTSITFSAYGYSDTPGISSVQFMVDGAPWGSPILSNHNLPYTLVVNSSGLSAGQHSLTAVETDYQGGTATSPQTATIDIGSGQSGATPSGANGPIVGGGSGIGSPIVPESPSNSVSPTSSASVWGEPSTPDVSAQSAAQMAGGVALTKNLAIGSSGPQVTVVQNYLISQGLLSPDSATGYFGLKTQSAVEKFQAAHGIVSSGSPATTGYGSVGPKTRAMLDAALSGSSVDSGESSKIAFTETLGLGSTGPQVTAIQSYLISQNLLPAGDDTGYFGTLTQSAVEKFQAEHGIVLSGSPATTGYGSVGPKTRAMLDALVGASQASGAPAAANSTVGI